MKRLKILSNISIAIIMLLIVASCQDNNNDPKDPGTSTTELLSNRVSETPPLIDGSIDGVWDESQILLMETVVPSVDFENFKGYVGDGTEVQIPSTLIFCLGWLSFNKAIRTSPSL